MMTLNKQLWAIITTVVVFMFLCGVLVSTASNIHQINQQLAIKNNDSANLLAQMLTEIDKDPVLLELLISAQFDTGHYEYIKLRGINSDFDITLEFEGTAQANAPLWFSSAINIDAPAGVAHISDGWSQFGTIEIKSHSGFFVSEIWAATIRFAIWSALIGIVIGSLSMVLQRIVTRPLDKVINQAEALGEKRFISLPLPKTIEYRRLVSAMNLLTRRVKSILEKENDKLNALRAKTEHDELTGLANRNVYLSNLGALLASSDKSEDHGVAIIRLRQLDKLNKELGRRHVDAFIIKLAQTLELLCKHNVSKFESYTVARLNGSDFSILVSHPTNFSDFSRKIYESVASLCNEQGLNLNQVLVGSTNFSSDDTKAQTLMRIDSVLSDIESNESNSSYLHSDEARVSPYLTTEDWRVALESAVKAQQVFFQLYPVIMVNENRVIHYEGMIRAQLKDEIRSAGFFLPWARRLGLIDVIELSALHRLFERSVAHDKQTSIKLSYEFLSKEANRAALKKLAQLHPYARVSIEIHEIALIEHFDAIESYCVELQKAGFSIGLQSALNCFNQLSNIQQLGLDFIKLHATLTQGAHESVDGQNILKGFCRVGHSLGTVVIAQGFQPQHDRGLLEELGVDGLTGPGVNLS
ncbi:EAL domain-containing protein [Aliidiomarina quisquiliarum]|uniref:EAL domain-containing protein n=1 Tax=Aliidiomarina quisquiliarum TaxID=2938947 RepID=UPI00208E859D|nr:LapD/MoxY N-terminal periplasmic domain-containing protein [Aliidiomarina quisquiliarum]MCO4322144.1 EAL domain-containing protein [Aliidiomarina quisquiliarum]